MFGSLAAAVYWEPAVAALSLVAVAGAVVFARAVVAFRGQVVVEFWKAVVAAAAFALVAVAYPLEVVEFWHRPPG